MAVRYGMEEAVFLDALMFWYRTNRGDNRNFRDGRWWTHNSVKAYAQVFPWWSEKQIRRIIESCKVKGAVLSENYNQDRRDRTFWYTPSDDLLSLYGEDVTGNCNLPNGQMQEQEGADSSAQKGKPLPCTTHVETEYVPPIAPQGARRSRRKKSVPVCEPERFEKFWRAYPRDEDRARAVEEWDKLLQDKELLATHGGDASALLDEISLGLGRHLSCDDWQKNVGIPYAFRWLRDRRWKEKQKIPVVRTAFPGGWAPDPEVY